MKNKRLMFALVLGILVISMISFVSARSFQEQVDEVTGKFGAAFDGVWRGVMILGGAIFNVASDKPDIILGKLLVFATGFAIFYIVLRRIKIISEAGWPLWVLSIGGPFVGARFITESAVASIVNPSNAVILVAVVLIPFLVFAYLIEVEIEVGVFRRIAWFACAAIYAAVAATSFIGGKWQGGPLLLIFAGLCAVMGWRGTRWVNSWFHQAQANKAKRERIIERIAKLEEKLKKAEDYYNNTRDPRIRVFYEDQVQRIQSDIDIQQGELEKTY